MDVDVDVGAARGGLSYAADAPGTGDGCGIVENSRVYNGLVCRAAAADDAVRSDTAAAMAAPTTLAIEIGGAELVRVSLTVVVVEIVEVVAVVVAATAVAEALLVALMVDALGIGDDGEAAAGENSCMYDVPSPGISLKNTESRSRAGVKVSVSVADADGACASGTDRVDEVDEGDGGAWASESAVSSGSE